MSAVNLDDLEKEVGASDSTGQRPAKPLIEFFTPSELSAFTPPEGFKLVGDYHIQKASPFVIGGAPGVGKSRGAVALAVAGATGADWFGLKVHRLFKTMIVQAENGRVRLKNEFADLDCATLDEFVRVCSRLHLFRDRRLPVKPFKKTRRLHQHNSTPAAAFSQTKEFEFPGLAMLQNCSSGKPA